MIFGGEVKAEMLLETVHRIDWHILEQLFSGHTAVLIRETDIICEKNAIKYVHIIHRKFVKMNNLLSMHFNYSVFIVISNFIIFGFSFLMVLSHYNYNFN